MTETLEAEALVRRFSSPAELYDCAADGRLRRLAGNEAARTLGPLGEAQARSLAVAVERGLVDGATQEIDLVRVLSGVERSLRLNLMPLLDGSGVPVSVLCLMQDGVSDRTSRAERLRALLELTTDDIWECDGELRLSRIHGRNADQRPRLTVFLGRTTEEVLDPAMPPEDFPRLKAALEAREPFRELTFPVCLPTGEQEWMRLSGFPLFSAAGTFTGYLGTSSRVTEERQRMATERRRQQLESLGQLAGGVAHEFNNLLVPITMLSKMGLARVGDDETLRLFLSTIHENGWKAAEIVRSVLTYARQMTPTAGPIACGEVVAERIHLLRQALPPSVVFETAIEDCTSRVIGNAGELSQIIVNLFTNASEAVAGYGIVRCTVERVPMAAAARRSTGIASAEAMRIIVADSGKGIAPEIRDRIFEPFFTTKPVGQGTGLGLSVVDGIVKDWGGHISVAGNPGVGAEFTILLPVVDDETLAAMARIG
ncbi:MAG: ATP-binding protein [Rhodospirillaceae bacterium]